MSSIQAIDHVLCRVGGIARAAAGFASLGFTLTPESHITTMGLVNQLVLFPPPAPGLANFIELMAVADPARMPPPMAALLAGEDGVRSLVLSGPDAFAARTQLNDAGYAFAPPAYVKRDWVLPSGEILSPEFDVLLPTRTAFAFNYCHYRNNAPYTRAEWLQHVNGIVAFAGVLAVSEDAAAVLAEFERVFAARARAGALGLPCVTPGHVDLHVASSGEAAALLGAPVSAGFAGVVLRSGDLARTEAAWRAAGSVVGIGPGLMFPDGPAGFPLISIA